MPDLNTLLSFYSLFKEYRFHIPDYQRGYAWGKDQLTDLLEDMSSLPDNDEDDNDHFTGLLALHENKDLRKEIKGIFKPVFDVVDGQQRLTTLVILMKEISRAMENLGEDGQGTADDIKQTFLYELGDGKIPMPKLILDANNREYFERNILEMEASSYQSYQGEVINSHSNLLQARAFFFDELKRQRDTRGDAYPQWLKAFYRKASSKLKVIVYRLRSDADAGVIFEGMNNRGKKPNNMDLVKNYLLFAASKLSREIEDDLGRKINRTWTTIFEKLKAIKREEHEDSLLEFHWITIYDYDRKHWSDEKQKSDHIKKRLKGLLTDPARHDDLRSEIEGYASTMQGVAGAYADVYSPGHTGAFAFFDRQPEFKKQIIEYSEKLLRLGALRSFTPLLIAAWMKLREDAQAYLNLLMLCERYAFRVFRVASNRVDSGSESVLFRLGNQFYNGKITYADMIENLQRDLHRRCSDSIFAQEFNIDNAKPWYGRNGLKYLLYEFEEHLQGNDEPLIQWSVILNGSEKTIEHILPQNPEQDSDWTRTFTAEQRERYKHVLGNLTLTVDNSRLGNKPFSDKKALYENSNLKCERELKNTAEWTPEAIEARQKLLTEWAVKRWYVHTPPPPPEPGLDALKARAKANGFGDEFMRIHELATRLNLPPKANKNRMSYKSPAHYGHSVIKVYTYANGMEVSFNFQFFPNYLNVPESRIREIFDDKHYWWLTADQVNEFIERLEKLVDEVEKNRA